MQTKLLAVRDQSSVTPTYSVTIPAMERNGTPYVIGSVVRQTAQDGCWMASMAYGEHTSQSRAADLPGVLEKVRKFVDRCDQMQDDAEARAEMAAENAYVRHMEQPTYEDYAFDQWESQRGYYGQ